MKVIYYISRQDTKDWWTCPPALECTHDEEMRLRKIWDWWTNKEYIVDPLSHKQCLYYMISRLPLWWLRKMFIKKEMVKID